MCVVRLVGKAKFSLQDVQGSEVAYRQALALSRQRPDAYKGLLELHLSTGQDLPLVEDYRALVSLQDAAACVHWAWMLTALSAPAAGCHKPS